MSKVKLFLENFLIYGMGGIISKIIPLIMVPIVTRIMPSSDYYGLSDLSSTVVSFASAMAVMGMYDAMYRMFFEKDDEEYKKDICSTAFLFTMSTSLIIFILMLLFRNVIANLVMGNRQYGYLICISAVSTLIGATNSIVAAPTRMQNKRTVFLIMNTVTPLLSYSIAIPLILAGHYVIALPLAGMLSACLSEAAFVALNRKWFRISRFRKEYLKPLLVIALPLLPNFLIYWVFNSCDKLMITHMLGMGETGIYSVGAKLGHASQLIYTAFAGGWQYFAFSTMREKDQVKSNSKVFEYLGIISFACSVFVFALCEPLYQLLFTGEYTAGYIVSPYLFLAPLLLMLFQVAMNQLLVIKKTWPNIFILSVGALANICLNLWLIPVLGIEGAAIASLMGYIISDILCMVVLCRMRLMEVSGRFLVSAVVLGLYCMIWRVWLLHHWGMSFMGAVVVVIVYFIMYKKDISRMLRHVWR